MTIDGPDRCGWKGRVVDTSGARERAASAEPAYWVIAGCHRLAAAQLLRWSEIDAFVVDLDHRQAELVEIDENLIRAELTDVQRARSHARRAVLMAEMGLVSRPGEGGDRRSPDKLSSGPSYAAQAAGTLG